jgi:hypothetical protein
MIKFERKLGHQADLSSGRFVRAFYDPRVRVTLDSFVLDGGMAVRRVPPTG